MADITLSIPDTILGTVAACLCKAGGHVPTGNATTDCATAKQVIIAWITQTVQNVQTAEATVPQPPATPVTGIS